MSYNWFIAREHLGVALQRQWVSWGKSPRAFGPTSAIGEFALKRPQLYSQARVLE